MRNHYLVCTECRKKIFFGQGYGICEVRGSPKQVIIDFIDEHFEHNIEVWDEALVVEEEL